MNIWVKIFSSWAFMRKGTLEVCFFSVRSFVRSFVREQILQTSIFLVNYKCDASYDHLWWPKGPEVDRKCHQTFRLSVQKWTGSVRLSVCPSQTLPLPPWWTLCEGTTSAGRLRPAIFIKKTLKKANVWLEKERKIFLKVVEVFFLDFSITF